MSIESLRRELQRNAQLRELCGFSVLKGSKGVPSSYVYSRFLARLMKHQEQINEIFNQVTTELKDVLPGFGTQLAGDGKAIQTHANPRKFDDSQVFDGRRDIDANTGVKKYKGIREDGSPWEKIKSWFGYKIHLLVDTEYELPIAFEVTKASNSEGEVMKKMFENLNILHPKIVENSEYAFFDKGYDDEKFIKKLWDEYKIKPIIDIRNMWKDSDKTRLIPETTNLLYDYKGTISCACPFSGDIKEMAFGGFEKDRESLKYRCPLAHYGVECKEQKKCPIAGGVRIPMSLNRRIFTPVARSSYKWKKLYKARTSVERVNSRLDVSFGFERHFIRGLKKMKLRCGIALVIMSTMALGRAREKKEELIRSLVKKA